MAQFSKRHYEALATVMQSTKPQVNQFRDVMSYDARTVDIKQAWHTQQVKITGYSPNDSWISGYFFDGPASDFVRTYIDADFEWSPTLRETAEIVADINPSTFLGNSPGSFEVYMKEQTIRIMNEGNPDGSQKTHTHWGTCGFYITVFPSVQNNNKLFATATLMPSTVKRALDKSSQKRKPMTNKEIATRLRSLLTDME